MDLSGVSIFSDCRIEIRGRRIADTPQSHSGQVSVCATQKLEWRKACCNHFTCRVEGRFPVRSLWPALRGPRGCGALSRRDVLPEFGSFMSYTVARQPDTTKACRERLWNRGNSTASDDSNRYPGGGS